MPSLSLPVEQNWSCHGCGGCCYLYEVVITDEERQRIIDQHWSEQDGIPAGTELFRRVGGLFSKKYVLARRKDRGCVFLDEKGLCRIHAKFGEPAKPLVCRLFPFVLYPTGSKVTVSLRFSCPSTAGNRGKAMSERREEIEEFCRLGAVSPATDPPAISRGQQLDWPDTLRIARHFAGLVSGEMDEGDATPLALRVIYSLFVADMIGKAKFDKVRGERLDDLMDTLIGAAPGETVQDLDEVDAPQAAAKVQLRMLTAQYAQRHPLTVVGIGYRVTAAAARVRMTRGS